MTTEFIKWGCKYAGGFEYTEGDFQEDCILTAPSDKTYEIYCLCDYSEWLPVVRPLFLQRVIEGLNNALGYIIDQNNQLITVYDIHDDYKIIHQEDFDDYETTDQAKEAALIWIMDNEKA